MPKNKPQKSLNTGKIQIIYGMHAVRAALLNTKRVHHELHITENTHEFAKNYKSTIKKITIFCLKGAAFKNIRIFGLDVSCFRLTIILIN